MPHHTPAIKTVLIDYLHRNGGVGEREALLDAAELVYGIDRTAARTALSRAAQNGDLQKDGSTYAIDYDDPTSGWVEGT
jgi:DNA-binding transcriptional regulator PaaX